MPFAESLDRNELTVKDLFPNPLQRTLFRVKTLGDSCISLMRARDQKQALWLLYEFVDGVDHEDIDARLDEFYCETKNNIYNQRQRARWLARCNQVVDEAIGPIASQRRALHYIDEAE